MKHQEVLETAVVCHSSSSINFKRLQSQEICFQQEKSVVLSTVGSEFLSWTCALLTVDRRHYLSVTGGKGNKDRLKTFFDSKVDFLPTIYSPPRKGLSQKTLEIRDDREFNWGLRWINFINVTTLSFPQDNDKKRSHEHHNQFFDTNRPQEKALGVTQRHSASLGVMKKHTCLREESLEFLAESSEFLSCLLNSPISRKHLVLFYNLSSSPGKWLAIKEGWKLKKRALFRR